MAIEERQLWAATLHIVHAGAIPAWGAAIKGDDVFYLGKRFGTLMSYSCMPGGYTVRYLAKQ